MGVELVELVVFFGGKLGVYKIDGVGVGFVVLLWREGIVDCLEVVFMYEVNEMLL